MVFWGVIRAFQSDINIGYPPMQLSASHYQTAGPGRSWCLLSITGFPLLSVSATSQARLKGGPRRGSLAQTPQQDLWLLIKTLKSKYEFLKSQPERRHGMTRASTLAAGLDKTSQLRSEQPCGAHSFFSIHGTKDDEGTIWAFQSYFTVW